MSIRCHHQAYQLTNCIQATTLYGRTLRRYELPWANRTSTRRTNACYSKPERLTDGTLGIMCWVFKVTNQTSGGTKDDGEQVKHQIVFSGPKSVPSLGSHYAMTFVDEYLVRKVDWVRFSKGKHLEEIANL